MQSLDAMVRELYGCSAHLRLVERMIGADETQDKPSPELIANDLLGMSEELERLADTADRWWLEIKKLKRRIAELESKSVGQ